MSAGLARRAVEVAANQPCISVSTCALSLCIIARSCDNVRQRLPNLKELRREVAESNPERHRNLHVMFGRLNCATGLQPYYIRLEQTAALPASRPRVTLA